MPTSKQKRQAAQRHLQRQLERRAELARKRRQRNIVLAAALSVLVVLGGIYLLTQVVGKNSNNTASAASSTASASATPSGSAAPGACTFAPVPAGSPNVKDVGVPQTPAPTAGTVDLAVTTSQGNMTFTLDRASAPCAAQSFAYLAGKGFFDGSPCHRLVNQPTFGVLQCGDPSGTGMGGPSYRFGQEPPTATKPYPKGAIAMANSGQPDSTGSQFFIMFQDTDLPPNYSVVGTVTAGLDVVEKVAAAGNDGSFDPSPGGGKPKLPITIQTVKPVQ